MVQLLEIQHVSKTYGAETILSDVSLTLEKGKALAITGQSGSGKTTLLSIIGLLQQPTSGGVLIGGEAVDQLAQHKQASIRAQNMGFVFQRARLISSLTALENVLVPAWLANKGKNFEQRARKLLVGFGLEHRLSHRPQELSLGQLRRVALARALLFNPPIILADEPTNDLDPVLAKTVVDCLLHARDNGTGVMIVTHDQTIAAKADNIFYLDNGCLAVKSTANQLGLG